MWGWLTVAAIVGSPVVFLAYGAFPAFVLLTAAVLSHYAMVDIATADLEEYVGRLAAKVASLDEKPED
jgi:hypothetical protein